MDFTTKMTNDNEAVTWTQDVAHIGDVSYDAANRTIVVVFDGKVARCRISGYERASAVALWKQLVKACKSKDLVLLCARGGWSPTQWFCGMHNHTEEYLEAEEWAADESHFLPAVEVHRLAANRLLP